MTEKFRITYATMSADNEELQAAYDAAAERARAELGKAYPVDRERGGALARGRLRGALADRQRHRDRPVLAGHHEDVEDAVAAAKAFQLDVGSDGVAGARAASCATSPTSWRSGSSTSAALMAFEVGKSRLEALGDVQETAELIRWNCDEMEKHDGFRTPMSGLGAAGDYYDVMRPHGVWAVISPFNFPMALSGGPSSGALVAGNTVVLKPSNQGALLGYKLYECYRDGGVPAGAFHLVTGRGVKRRRSPVEAPRRERRHLHRLLRRRAWTSSRTSRRTCPKPVICEMGGKNPTIVTKNADIDKATDGVLRSAFGFGGQKCSACSRVFVEREVYDDFLSTLKTKTEKIKVGNPIERDVYLGPIINEPAMETFEEASEEARKNGTIVTGGQRITEGDFGRGLFVEPTIVEAPADSWIWKKELFVPFVAVAPFEELDDAIEKANDTEYGLTAGLFSEDEQEIQEWLDRIHAGVVYVNRRAGSTTGAWPGVQPFGGWKASGTTGKAGGGPYYVMQYLREQSRTVISE